MREVAVKRLRLPPVHRPTIDVFNEDMINMDLLSIILEFLAHYQLYSQEACDIGCFRLSNAAFAQLWIAIESERPFIRTASQFSVDKLAYAVLRNTSFSIL
ncbi:hypothetical protein FRC07_012379, partial [Ceratobasidium sp. 392]